MNLGWHDESVAVRYPAWIFLLLFSSFYETLFNLLLCMIVWGLKEKNMANLAFWAIELKLGTFVLDILNNNFLERFSPATPYFPRSGSNAPLLGFSRIPRERVGLEKKISDRIVRRKILINMVYSYHTVGLKSYSKSRLEELWLAQKWGNYMHFELSQVETWYVWSRYSK